MDKEIFKHLCISSLIFFTGFYSVLYFAGTLQKLTTTGLILTIIYSCLLNGLTQYLAHKIVKRKNDKEKK